jgi:predicted secreted protein
MKTIMIILVAANIFILGCKVEEKKPVPQETQVQADVKQAADELNKQIDVLSANLKGTTAVLKEEMPGIVQKVQELIAELQVAGNEIEKSLGSIAPQAAEQPQAVALKTIEVPLGKNALISLESNHTTGYMWQLAKPLDKDILELINTQYITTETGLIGAGGKEAWNFKALKKGSTEVSLVYVRPWEKDKPPARQAAFVIIVK